MGLQAIPGQLEKLIGTFYRTNTKTPRSRPDNLNAGIIERLIITKGRLQIGFDDSIWDVEIPEVDQVDQETYLGYTEMITDQIVQVLQAGHLRKHINEAMKNHGIVAYFDMGILKVNALTLNVGEQDQFPVE